ncbi:MAG: DUF1566 domain-containing protein [Sulfuritalea sp.]|nr:DUF1566 domain-containing protein [Sulfuritalea sp.]MDP1984277.1 DUF1566 domain-containing protein [Sulfuritalea sp.]
MSHTDSAGRVIDGRCKRFVALYPFASLRAGHPFHLGFAAWLALGAALQLAPGSFGTARAAEPAPADSAATGQPGDNSLPDLAQPVSSSTRVRPSSSGIAIDSNDAYSRFSANTETSQRTGVSVGVRGGVALGDAAALGGGAQMGGNSSELFLNLGLRLGDAQRLMFTAGQLRQKLEFNFSSGNSRAEMTQNSVGASWRFKLGSGLFDYAEVNAYAARTASRDLEDLTYAIDTATLYELWNDPRRIAGGRMAGVQARLGLKPWDSGRINVGFGQEQLRYDLLGGAENHNRATGSLGLEQSIDSQTRLKFGADAAAAQTRYNLGFDHRFGTLGTLGVDLANIRGRDNAPNDSRVQLSWTIPLGKSAAGSSPGSSPASPAIAGRSEGPRMGAVDALPVNPDLPRANSGNDGLLDQVATRPAWMPSQVIAKLDTTAAPTRLIAVDKTALPAGSSVNTTTGAITTPLGVVVTGIAGVTLNAAPFANAGQFGLSGNSLVIDPGKITQPAVGVVDIYVITVNNFGGGTTLVTVNVSHGSVKIDSITIGAATDTTPDAFTFVDQTNIARSTLTESAAITVAGINAAAAISVAGGEYQINGGAWTGAAGTITNGQTVKVRHTTSASTSTATNTVLTIGGVSDTFTTTTVAGGITVATVSQGGLIWTENDASVPNGEADLSTANTFCTTQTINGQTGWRLPTVNELVTMYNSNAINGQGWTLSYTWSSTLSEREWEGPLIVDLSNGGLYWDSGNPGQGSTPHYVSCVRSAAP